MRADEDGTLVDKENYAIHISWFVPKRATFQTGIFSLFDQSKKGMSSFLLVFPSDSGIASLSRSLSVSIGPGPGCRRKCGWSIGGAASPSAASKRRKTRKGGSEEWTDGREGGRGEK